MNPPPVEKTPWKNGLFGCCANPGQCVYVFCCSYCAFADVAVGVRGGSWCLNCLYSCCCPLCAFWCTHSDLRSTIKQKKNLEGSTCPDCCVVCWCSECALCQETAEINIMRVGENNPNEPKGITHLNGQVVQVVYVQQQAGGAQVAPMPAGQQMPSK
eukprot:Nk52_evm21s62 gene=Nk52_evmTU21s62